MMLATASLTHSKLRRLLFACMKVVEREHGIAENWRIWKLEIAMHLILVYRDVCRSMTLVLVGNITSSQC